MRRLLITGLVLFLLVIFVSQTTVFAQPTGNTTISGEVGETLSLTPPTNCSFETLTPGNDATIGPKTVTVNSNRSGWYLTVEESGGDGYMARDDSHHLTGPLQIKGGDIPSYTPLISRVTLVNGDGASGTGVAVNDIYFQQYVDPGEEAGVYLITLTFTVSASLP